jgi:hypothetical protein
MFAVVDRFYVGFGYPSKVHGSARVVNGQAANAWTWHVVWHVKRIERYANSESTCQSIYTITHVNDYSIILNDEYIV